LSSAFLQKTRINDFELTDSKNNSAEQVVEKGGFFTQKSPEKPCKIKKN